MGNLSALLFLGISYWLPTLSQRIRSDRPVLSVIWLALTMRHGIALLNAFVAPISTTWGDLYRFHNIGAGLSLEKNQPYGEFLRVLYKIFGVSFWLGEEASIIASSLTFIVLVELAALLGIERRRVAPCVFLLGCLPSPAIHCSVTLREAFQALGFLAAVYSLIRLRSQPTPWAIPLLLASLAMLVFMHQSLAVFAVGLIVLGIPWAMQGIGQLPAMIAVLCLTLAPVLVPTLLNNLQETSVTARYLNEGKFLHYATTYRDNVLEARSDYGMKIDSSSAFSMISTSVLVVAMYFVAPLPWQVSSPMDFYACFEVLLRVAFVYGFYQQFSTATQEFRQRMLFLLATSMCLEMMWAIGTTNWGTSLRHHVVSFGAFILLGFPYYCSFTLDPELAGLLRRRERRKTVGGDFLTAPANDILALRNLVSSKLKLYLGLVCVASLIVCVVTRPRLSMRTGPVRATYISYASLLLPGNTRFSMKRIFATSGQSDLDFWLTDPTLFDKLIERLRIREKVRAELQQKNPLLAPLGSTVNIIAFKTGGQPVTTPGAGSVSAKYGFSAETFEKTEEQPEIQYAQLSTGEDDDWEVHQNRLNRIVIRGAGSTAADSKLVVEVTVRILRSELEALAVRRSQKRKKTIEGFIAAGNKRIERLYRNLQKRAKSDPLRVQQLNRRHSQLSQKKLEIDAQLVALRRQLSATADASPSADALLETIQGLERELRQAEIVFLPASFTATRLRERLAALRGFASRVQSERSAQLATELRSKIDMKQSDRERYQAEMMSIESRRPTPGEVVTYRGLERELGTWESQLLAWEQQLLQTRIEERLCRGDGTAVILQGALPGARSQTATTSLFNEYRKTLAMLPLAPLAALVAVLLMHIVQTARQIRSRAEYYFDAPVLGELPKLPKAYRQSWNSLKSRERKKSP